MLPFPSVLSTKIFPCIISVSFLVMESPRPVPPNFFMLCPDACLKASNIFALSHSAIPMPVSSIEILKSTLLLFLEVVPFSESFTYPLSVNFTAFPTRFNSICLTLTSSRRILSSKSS